MRWVCADKNACDCRLVANGSGGEENSGKTVTKPGSSSTQPCLACRVRFFAIPAYPEAARVAKKQGVVSATLVLTPEGDVKNVRIESGDAQFFAAVTPALSTWRFTSGGRREESIPVSVKFVLSENTDVGVSGASLLNAVVTAQHP
jgi:TonB family protein